MPVTPLSLRSPSRCCRTRAGAPPLGRIFGGSCGCWRSTCGLKATACCRGWCSSAWRSWAWSGPSTSSSPSTTRTSVRCPGMGVLAQGRPVPTARRPGRAKAGGLRLAPESLHALGMSPPCPAGWQEAEEFLWGLFPVLLSCLCWLPSPGTLCPEMCLLPHPEGVRSFESPPRPSHCSSGTPQGCCISGRLPAASPSAGEGGHK